jgi:hypothetical protein
MCASECCDRIGFNNMRIGFEYAFALAWLTNRTLVIPPRKPW